MIGIALAGMIACLVVCVVGVGQERYNMGIEKYIILSSVALTLHGIFYAGLIYGAWIKIGKHIVVIIQ